MRDLEFQAADWTEITLGDVCTFRGGSGFKESHQGQSHGDHPFIKVSDLNLKGNEKYVTTAQNWVSEDVLRELRATLQPVGAVVFAKVGAALKLNRRRILTRPTAIDNNMMAAIPDTGQLDGDFLYYFLLVQDLGKFSQESAVPSVNQGHLSAIEISLPPLLEQRKIAALLRTWDNALEKLNALRAAKLRRMDGVAQVLLDPSRAIGSDVSPSNWSLSNFGELFEERQDRNSGSTVDDVVTVGKYAIRKQSEHFTRSVASKDLSNYWTISPGDFVYDPMSAYYGAIGRYLGNSDGIVSPAYRVIRLKNGHDPDFISALLKAHHIRFLLETRSSQGNKEGKRRLLQRDEFERIEFKLPTKEMQIEIANKLSVFQTDLDLADAEIKSLTDQKRGLMQKLLTGEWRVEVSDDEEAAA
ncbi:restriction endonuclease subunit S [Cognatishimia activa]|uniref:restriction endonuclease subunit S n=1 Tax=Cognatishimia activa TaxID=1715691 RepID=UPI0006F01C29|nr:restriction endonuclease subunit S [Cognatishimia activa]CUJ30260.1 Type I restriction modification DNA specificity domain protein [Cognatishimia activa]